MNQREKRIIYLAVCISRVIFLFWDIILSNNQKISPSQIYDNKPHQQIIISEEKLHQSNNQQQKQAEQNLDIQTQQKDTHNISILQEQIDTLDLSDFKSNSSNNFDDIQILKNIYSKNQNKDVLNILLEKFIYEQKFNEAKNYILNINNWDYSKDIDPHIYLHILINSISITNPNEIIKFEAQIDQLYKQWFLSKDDRSFYIWLINIRNKNRNQASKLFSSISSPRYFDFIKNYNDTLSNSYFKEDIPSYYQDWLIAVAMLKNWYFSIAKKIALNVVMKNDNYILPYQILAYSHFLTNDRDAAIDYLFKLIDINPAKEENYKFLIWVSYYRNQKYEQSVLYLSQIKDKIYQSDVHRYLILNYIAWDDTQRLVRIRQSMLWQNNLEKSDFYSFFYHVFFLPFKNQKSSDIYKQNPHIAISFLTKCYEIFDSSNDDICIYGQAGQDIATNNRNWAKDKLLYLADRYPQSYIYHALWDYYLRQKDMEKSKENYLKAVWMTTSPIEKSIIRNKLVQ